MRIAFAKGVAAFALAATLFAGSALAASVTIQVVVGEDGVAGVPVEVMASAGAESFITDQNGECSSDIRGLYFRLKVNNEILPGVYNVSDGNVVVSLEGRPENGGQK